MTVSDLDIERRILTLLGQRAESASICPSDVARALFDEEQAWRSLMPSVRQVAARLAGERIIAITQRGETLDPHRLPRGPIRLRRGTKFPTGFQR
ncbi:DUF3253 domain-containing protein [Caballeronia sp. LZ062]|uniref:DUF3253 domain-containing protein n=1 Tax=unclassified Caballeronia TaxID=2646786 RepID=UPI00285B00CD|nr:MULTISPECIES: DUF3253 domain-containing protein [unclassified Caballeronia]MDR5855255.1 DUF3253 domain-containing protein [Caballeronia sp. LZ050]MDR5870216.1 DUF3253 domain-containing protein [Caballeronia sp. LZ062]